MPERKVLGEVMLCLKCRHRMVRAGRNRYGRQIWQCTFCFSRTVNPQQQIALIPVEDKDAQYKPYLNQMESKVGVSGTTAILREQAEKLSKIGPGRAGE